MRAGTLAVGIVLFIFGLILTATIIGAIIGIPLLLIGLILLIVGAVTSEPRPVVYVAPQPMYYPPPPPPQYAPPTGPPVTVNVHQTPAMPAPPQIMRRCQFCGSVYPEAQLRCPKCGAAF